MDYLPISLTASPLPSVVKIVAGNVTSNSFLLTWCHSPMESTSTPYTAYMLEYWETDSSSPRCSISLAGRVKEHTVTGLKPQTTYCMKMAAENAAGRGPFCEALPVQTGGEYQLLCPCTDSLNACMQVDLIQFGCSPHYPYLVCTLFDSMDYTALTNYC